jgi:glutamate carboxypeptidase
MDITQLPFDAEVMLAGLKPWVECESPTFDASRVNAMMDSAFPAAWVLAIACARASRLGTRASPVS